jgi:hypothetical protein
MDRQLALQRGFQALEDDIRRGQTATRPRRRERVKNSWRDQGKGECWTKTGKGGGAFVVCEGSKGQAGVYQPRGDRGDPDMKGRDKTEAIKVNRTVVRKYDDEGRINQEVGTQNYFIPIGEENGIVYLQQGINERGDVFGGSAFADLSDFNKADLIAIPKDKFNAQYRVHRGLENPRDKWDGLVSNKYELAGVNEREQGSINDIDPTFRGFRRTEEVIGEARDLGGGRAGFRQAIAARRQRGRRESFRRDLRRTDRDRRVLRQLGYNPDDFLVGYELDRARRRRRGEEEEE